MQRADGAFGALIIRKPVDDIPKQSILYDYDLVEHVMIMQDWDHRTGVSGFNSFHHSIGQNKPNTILINAKGRYFEPPSEKTNAEIKAKNDSTTTSTTTTAAPTTTPDSQEPLNSDVVSPKNVYEAPIGVVSREFSRASPLPPPDNLAPEASELESNSEEIPTQIFESMKLSPTDQQPLNDDKEYSVTLKRQKRAMTPTQAPTASGAIEAQFTPYEIFNVKHGFKYRFRTINSGFLNCPLEISIDNHTLNIIASDGHYIEPIEVETLVSYAGERFDFVVHTNQAIGNYWIRAKGLMDCDERFTRAHQGAILRYKGAPAIDPDGELSYDFKRGGMQMNSLNRGTGHVDSVSIAEATSAEPDIPKLLEENADYKFYVYYDFYNKNFPQFNHPELYNMNSGNILENK